MIKEKKQKINSLKELSKIKVLSKEEITLIIESIYKNVRFRRNDLLIRNINSKRDTKEINKVFSCVLFEVSKLVDCILEDKIDEIEYFKTINLLYEQELLFNEYYKLMSNKENLDDIYAIQYKMRYLKEIREH